ncbi:hypothetical protein [Achromobacter anxifer]|jgi:hypothetical protein|uniref:hypothetical protein n=1 Tax=Achromobacter anxifer TaxID=1287737 RepID=UPI001583335C|nr:hypothetical protein [Achromobacter anxifer]
MGWIDSTATTGKPELVARADKAWIEYYIQLKRATSFLQLAFFSMDERRSARENFGLEYQLVYKMGFAGRLGLLSQAAAQDARP